MRPAKRGTDGRGARGFPCALWAGAPAHAAGGECDDDCHHVSNKITRDKIASWAGRQPHAYDIVEEESGEQRIICVYLVK